MKLGCNFVLVTCETVYLHSEISSISDDESLKTDTSNEEISEINPVTPLCSPLPNQPNDYSHPPPFNMFCDYQSVNPFNYTYDPPLSSLNVSDKELPCNRYEDKSLPAILKK